MQDSISSSSQSNGKTEKIRKIPKLAIGIHIGLLFGVRSVVQKKKNNKKKRTDQNLFRRSENNSER